MAVEPTPAIRFLIKQAAEGHGLELALLYGVVDAESGFNPNAVGDAGHSIGLMQLHDEGAGGGMSIEERRDPARNLDVGAAYLRACQDATGSWIGTVGAFNAGLGGWQSGVVVWEHIERYLQAYLRWRAQLTQEAILPLIDHAWGRTRSQTVKHALVAIKRVIGLE